MNKAVIIFIILLFSSAAFAAAGTDYRSSPEGMLPGAGTAEGSSYSVWHGAGDVIGTTTGSAYSTDLGFIASSVTYATREAGNPIIADLRFDGRFIVSEDYVNPDVVITAIITDESGIDTAGSSVEVDSQSYSFANLPGDSTYDAASGNLIYKNPTPFGDGMHTFKIVALNTLEGVSSLSKIFKVESGRAKVVERVLCYPNPFNPNLGQAEITFHLNVDAKITLYLFNSLGQLVWKRNFSSGSEGGHAGYNVVPWNGETDFGEIAGNDVYFCRVVSNGKVIGKGKIAVLK